MTGVQTCALPICSNPHLAGKGKTGLLISCGAAIICGGAVALINFFWGVGQQV